MIYFSPNTFNQGTTVKRLKPTLKNTLCKVKYMSSKRELYNNMRKV